MRLSLVLFLLASANLFAQDEKVSVKTGLENHISSKVKSVDYNCVSRSIDFALQAAQVALDERENIFVKYQYNFTSDEVVEVYDLKTTKRDKSKIKEKVNVKTVTRPDQSKSKSFSGNVSGYVFDGEEYVQKDEALMIVEAIALDKSKREECEASRARLQASIR